MRKVTNAKLALAILGIALFGLGARFDAAAARWAGIALVAAAWLLRFAGDRPGANQPEGKEGGATE
ncbi:MAG: hypothetical protein HUU26_04395 [Gemmatimonadaceae bacterium]|nr:hypothetical protein [Gemmatimonadaceae bacterium]